MRPWLLLMVFMVGCLDDVEGALVGRQDVADTADADSSTDPHGLTVVPTALTFENAPLGESRPQVLALVNTADRALSVTGLGFSGHHGYRVTLAGLTYGTSDDVAARVVLLTPVTVAPHQRIELTVTFTPDGTPRAEALLKLFSNDPRAPNGLAVPLTYAGSRPCVMVTPASVDFGDVHVGLVVTMGVRVTACNDGILSISDFHLTGSPMFTVGRVSPLPLQLYPGQSATLEVTFVPGASALFQAEVEITSNAEPATLALTGRGVREPCPHVTIVCDPDDDELAVGAHVRCEAPLDPACSAPVDWRRWTLTRPDGEVVATEPSVGSPFAWFDLTMTGSWVLGVTVIDEQGSSAPEVFRTLHAHERGLLVELTAEGAQGQPAQAELHLRHEAGWFDPGGDAWPANPSPDWSVTGPADDPLVAEPTLAKLVEPHLGDRYRVGVYVPGDGGAGAVHAAVRVYREGTLVFTQQDVLLQAHDLWEVVDVTWPNLIQAVTSPPRIISGVEPPE